MLLLLLLLLYFSITVMNVAMEKRSRNKGFREAKMAFFFRAVVGAVATFGLSSATDSGIPSDYTVVHANVVMRHGERSRLVKSTAAEFGNNDGVAVREDGEKSEGLGGGGGGAKRRYRGMYTLFLFRGRF